MAEAVVFDLDGTLINSEYYKIRAWKKAFSSVGLEIDEDELVREWVVKGTSFSQTVKKYGLENVIEEDLRPIVSEDYLKSIETDVCLLPGVREAIDRLRGELPLGLATSSHRMYVDKLMDKFGFGEFFKGIACGSEVKALKPDPAVMLLAAERMGIEASECVAIDDAPKGVIAAKRAGMKAIAVPTKYTQFGDFDQADIVLPGLDEVTVELVRMI